MKDTSRNLRLGGILVLTLGASAWGQSVHVVAGDGSGDFVDLQAAVTAAADGDVILVRPHTERYGFTTIDGKALTILGEGDARPGVQDVRVRNLAVDEVVELRFLDIAGRSEAVIFGQTQYDGLELTSNLGCVWLEDLFVAGADGISDFGGSETGFPGLVVTGSACVVVVDSDVHGGLGGSSVAGTSRPGGDAGRFTNSQVALDGCTFVGGDGGTGFTGSGGQGGAGLDNLMSTVFASGSSLRGGDTGDTFSFPAQNPTTSGLVAHDGSNVQYVSTTFAAGAGPAPAGVPITAVGTPVVIADLADAHRVMKATAVVREGEFAQLGYAGQPGDLVLLRLSGTTEWTFVPSLKGVQHLGAPTVDAFLGAAGPGGTIDFSVRAPALPLGLEAATISVQPLVKKLGALRLGAPSTVTIIDASIPHP